MEFIGTPQKSWFWQVQEGFRAYGLCFALVERSRRGFLGFGFGVRGLESSGSNSRVLRNKWKFWVTIISPSETPEIVILLGVLSSV